MSTDKRWELIKKAQENATWHAIKQADDGSSWLSSPTTRNALIGGGVGALGGGVLGALDEGDDESRASRILRNALIGGGLGAGIGGVGTHYYNDYKADQAAQAAAARQRLDEQWLAADTEAYNADQQAAIDFFKRTGSGIADAAGTLYEGAGAIKDRVYEGAGALKDRVKDRVGESFDNIRHLMAVERAVEQAGQQSGQPTVLEDGTTIPSQRRQEAQAHAAQRRAAAEAARAEAEAKRIAEAQAEELGGQASINPVTGESMPSERRQEAQAHADARREAKELAELEREQWLDDVHAEQAAEHERAQNAPPKHPGAPIPLTAEELEALGYPGWSTTQHIDPGHALYEAAKELKPYYGEPVQMTRQQAIDAGIFAGNSDRSLVDKILYPQDLGPLTGPKSGVISIPYGHGNEDYIKAYEHMHRLAKEGSAGARSFGVRMAKQAAARAFGYDTHTKSAAWYDYLPTPTNVFSGFAYGDAKSRARELEAQSKALDAKQGKGRSPAQARQSMLQNISTNMQRRNDLLTGSK